MRLAQTGGVEEVLVVVAIVFSRMMETCYDGEWFTFARVGSSFARSHCIMCERKEGGGEKRNERARRCGDGG
jgi:hypothetical protein